MNEYTVRYKKDGEIVDGGVFTGGFGMKNARQCARAAIRTGAVDAVIVDTATDMVAARFEQDEAGAVAVTEVAEGLTGVDWAAGFIEEETPTEEPNEPGETPAFEDLKLDERGELGLGKTRLDPIGENGMSVDDAPEFLKYRAELYDPECPDRMEIILADSDEDAIRQALEYCTCEGEDAITLLELFLLNDDYDVIRQIDLSVAPSVDTSTDTPSAETPSTNGEDTDIITISIPSTGIDPAKLDNLCKMVTAKESLLRAALGLPADAPLPIRLSEDGKQLHFPWFPFTQDGDVVKAYATLIQKLAETAKKKKRVTSHDKGGADDDGSAKFRMRCLLLQLGFIGPEYKADRRILLQKLEGNSSYVKSDGYEKMQEKRRKPAAYAVLDADMNAETTSKI